MHYVVESVASNIYQSPNGTRYWTPIVDEHFKPQINVRYNTLEEVIQMYETYAEKSGFDTRLGTLKVENEVVKIRYVLCSMSGKPRGQDFDSTSGSSGSPVRRINFKVTNCPACIKIHRTKGGTTYEAYEFREAHNHGLIAARNFDLLTKKRKLSFSDQEYIAKCRLANVGPIRAHKLQVALKGGHHNVRGTKVDYKNLSRDIKEYIGNRDAQMVVDKLKERAKHLHNFTFDYQVKAGEPTKLFWVDDVSKCNYEALVTFWPLMLHTRQICIIFIRTRY